METWQPNYIFKEEAAMDENGRKAIFIVIGVIILVLGLILAFNGGFSIGSGNEYFK